MRLAPVAVLLILASPVAAQERPQLVPSRDVSVAYRTSGGNQAGQPPEMRMSWLVARGLLRVDFGGQGYLVTDTRGAQGFVVMEAQRMVMELPAGQNPAAGAMLRENARYTREGADRVAGLACTIWRIELEGQTSRACLTADGVMLRATGGNQPGEGTLEAISVTPGPQDPARFERPAGYGSVQPRGRPPQQGASEAPPRGTALPPPGLAPR
jgi:hypothetical protein